MCEGLACGEIAIGHKGISHRAPAVLPIQQLSCTYSSAWMGVRFMFPLRVVALRALNLRSLQICRSRYTRSLQVDTLVKAEEEAWQGQWQGHGDARADARVPSETGQRLMQGQKQRQRQMKRQQNATGKCNGKGRGGGRGDH